MSLKIRLARGGSKKRPFYRIVVADSRSPRDGRFIEKLGTYNPMLPQDAERVQFDAEKVQAWIAKGATPSDRVLRFLDEKGLAKRPARNNPQKGQPGKKAQERLDALKAAEEAKAAAAAAPAPEPEPEVEAPVEAPAEAPAEEAAATDEQA